MAFFDGVAAVLGNVCDKMRVGNIRNELNDILKHSESFSRGILRIKKLLLKIFPFANRVVELLYKPDIVSCVFGSDMSLTSTSGNGSLKCRGIRDTFGVDCVFYIHLIKIALKN